MGRRNITRFSDPHDSFSVNSGLRGESAPVHRQRLAFAASVRKKKKKKKKNSKKKSSKEDGEKAPAAKKEESPKGPV